MLTLVQTNNASLDKELTAEEQAAENSKKGEELLLSFLLWEQKFEGDAHDALDDPIEVFLCAQKEKPLAVV